MKVGRCAEPTSRSPSFCWVVAVGILGYACDVVRMILSYLGSPQVVICKVVGTAIGRVIWVARARSRILLAVNHVWGTYSLRYVPTDGPLRADTAAHRQLSTGRSKQKPASYSWMFPGYFESIDLFVWWVTTRAHDFLWFTGTDKAASRIKRRVAHIVMQPSLCRVATRETIPSHVWMLEHQTPSHVTQGQNFL